MQQQIKGPERKYPRKTFDSGAEGAPNTVLNELLEMQQYIDYSVFSKNQLRFAEKVFKSSAYIQNEGHIRGKNMFLKLNKPQYWNKTNLYLLFDSIDMVLNITGDILLEVAKMKIQSNDKVKFMAGEIGDVLKSISNYFRYLRKTMATNNDLIKLMQDSTKPEMILQYFLSCQGIEVTGTKILALGIVLATYAKVVSILTYVNPYVQVRKDSGVDTIKAPKILYDTIIMPEGERKYNGKSIYEGFTVLGDNSTFDPTVYDAGKKTLNVHETKETGERSNKSKTYSKNPLIRLKQHPMYALDIIFPIKIAPYIITRGDKFTNFYNYIKPYIVAVKLICSVVKISFDGVLSKFHTIAATGERIKPSYSLKSVNNVKQFTVKLYKTNNKINEQYMKDVLAYSPNRAYFEGSLKIYQNGDFSIVLTNLTASAIVDQKANLEATNKQIKSNINGNDTLDRGYILTNPADLEYYETTQNPGIKIEVKQENHQQENEENMEWTQSE